MSRLWKSIREFSLSPNQTELKPTIPNSSPASHQAKAARLDPADRQQYSVCSAIVPDDHVPENCEENVPNIKSQSSHFLSDASQETLAKLVETQQKLVAALQTERCNMTKTLSEKDETIKEKDKTIAELRLEAADNSCNRAGQLEQLLWLDSLVNEKEAKIYDRELALYAMNVTN